MKILILAIALALPQLSLARTVTIDVADDLTYKDIQTFADGTTFVTQPKIYGLHLKATTIGEAEGNSEYICAKVGGMKRIDEYVERLGVDVRTVTFYTVDKSPQFGTSDLVLETAICKL